MSAESEIVDIPLDRPPVVRTLTLRYDFQIEACEEHPGTVLNIGCNEDPADLRARFGPRVVNCDMEAWDHHMDRPNRVDRVFNCLEKPWPFADGEAELTLLGDIMEHFTVSAMEDVLLECERVSRKVAITVPEDTRIDEAHQHDVWERENYNLHTTVVTADLLRRVLAQTGWTPERWVEGLWGFDGIKGYCVTARRA